MKLCKLLGMGACLLAITAPSDANALTYFLTQDLGVRNNQHLCKYGNGKVYSVNATELCALQIEDSGPVRNPSFPSFGQTGFLKGEYQDGMTKICVYDVLGRKEELRINSVALCPLNHQF